MISTEVCLARSSTVVRNMIEGEEEKVQVSIEGKGLYLSVLDELGSRSAVTSMVEAAHGAVRPRGGAGEVRDLEASRLELMVMGRRAGSHVAALPSDGDRAVLGVTCGAAAGRSPPGTHEWLSANWKIVGNVTGKVWHAGEGCSDDQERAAPSDYCRTP